MKKYYAAALVGVCVFAVLNPPTSCFAQVGSFSDIQLWAGDGESATNKAALVIQWNTGAGPTYTAHSYAWGYGWNSGSPTGLDMLQAIDLLDPRLEVTYHSAFPAAAFGIYYDAQNNGSGYTPGIPDDLGGPEDGSANDPNNLYQEGWFSGFWNYSIFGGSFDYDIYAGPPNYEFLGTDTYNQAGSSDNSDVAWFDSGLGMSSRELSDGYWDALSYAPAFSNQPVQQPVAAVPEPSSVLLVLLGLLGVSHARRRA